LNNFKLQNPPNTPVIRRVTNEWTIAEFKLNLSYASWANVFNNDNDVNTMFKFFLNTYLMIFNHSFPCTKYFQNLKNKTWLTTGIKISSAHKRELYKLNRINNNLESRRHYKKYCRILTEVIKTAKKQYYSNLILNSKNKAKTTWDIIKAVTNNNSSKNPIPLIKTGGKLCNNTQTIVSNFNTYFIAPINQIQPNTSTNISNSLNYLNEIFKHPFPNIHMAPVTNKEIKDIIKSLKWKKTQGYDEIPNKELYALYSSPNIIRVIKSRRLRWAAHVARMGERRGAYRALVGKPEGRRPLGRPRPRWEGNIKMDLRVVGCRDADWVDLAQD
jgi:hypothetical protein